MNSKAEVHNVAGTTYIYRTDHLRTKIIINDETAEQVNQFTYPGFGISYKFSNDVEFELAIFFTINRYY